MPDNPAAPQTPTAPNAPTTPTGQSLAHREYKLTDTDLKHHSQELGLLGKIFGSASEQAGNVAGFSVIVSFVAAVAVMLWMPDGGSISKKDAALAFTGIITLALGFLFGRGSA